jgi:hypothetical protein
MAAQIRRDLYADVTSRILGYARVSTDGQTLDAQQAALAAAGAQRVFAEKINGAVTDRRQLAKALAALAPGDTLIVTKLDRLTRSTRDLLNTLDAIGKAGATFRSLGDTWADTTTPHTVDADGVRWPCGIRASSDPGAHRRRPHQGESPGRSVRPQTHLDPTSTRRSVGATCCGRSTRGNRSKLQRQSLDDQSACGRAGIENCG